MFRSNQHGGRLTKLRYVCSMCRVNCIDEHGFAQHLSSQKHLENELYEEERRLHRGPKAYNVDPISARFEEAFLETLASRHLDQRVLAHEVYHETFAQDRPMLELKKTCWESFGQFISSLRDRERIVAERDAKGWLICLHAAQLEADGSLPAGAAMPSLPKPKRRWDEAGPAAPRGTAAATGGRSKPTEEDWALAAASRAAAGAPTEGESEAAACAPTERTTSAKVEFAGVKRRATAVKRPAAAAFAEAADAAGAATAEEEADEEAAAAVSAEGGGCGGEECWAQPGLVVKVLRHPEGIWRRRKGAVTRLRPSRAAVSGGGGGGSGGGDGGGGGAARAGAAVEVEVEAVDAPGEHVWAALADLETVIPQVGRRVRVLGGTHRGAVARLRAIDEARFCVAVELLQGGTWVDGLPYEEVCKLAW